MPVNPVVSAQSDSDSGQSFEHLVKLLSQRYRVGKTESPQVIVIVGAAVSHWGDMPLWDSMKASIIERACFHFAGFLDEARRKLAPVLGLPDETVALNPSALGKWLMQASTEAICSIACGTETVGEAIRQLLSESFSGIKSNEDAGPRPQLAYELLAHLIKHKFVDHVINFNFDPLLDAAVENELSPADYDLIVSDHQVLKTGDRDIARIVKLHGTVRAPQTLRFALRDTELLTPGMTKVLDEMLREAAPGQKTHLVSLGYSWSDPGFLSWVTSRANFIQGITIVRKTNKRPDLCVVKEHAQALPVKVISTDQIKARGVSHLSIDHLLWALWDSVANCLNPDASETAKLGNSHVFVMPASRHILLGYWFGPNLGHDAMTINPESAPAPVNPHTIENRFEAELLLHLVKCKGMINLRVMARDCRLNRIRPKLTGKHVLDAKDYLCRNKYAGVNETYFATAQHVDDLWKLMRTRLSSRQLLEPVFEHGRISLVRRDADEFFSRHTKAIFGAPEIEIVRDSSPSTHWLFVNPRSLSTLHEFRKTSQVLIDQHWTHLLVVAETGEWLASDEMLDSLRRKRSSLLLVRASLDSLDQWHLGRMQVQEARSRIMSVKDLKCAWGELTWWQHNRHLTLAYDDNAGRFVGGIYFQRRLKAHQVAPVYLEGVSDCIELFNTFLAYVRRSCEEAAIRGIEAERLAVADSSNTRARNCLIDCCQCLLLAGQARELTQKVLASPMLSDSSHEVPVQATDAINAVYHSIQKYVREISESHWLITTIDRANESCPNTLRNLVADLRERTVVE